MKTSRTTKWILLATLLITAFSFNRASLAAYDRALLEFNKGIERFRKNEFIDAIGYFNKAKQLGLNNGKLHYNLGVTYYRLERYKEALQELAQSARNTQLRSSAHFNAGLVYLKMKKTNQARKQFQLAYDTASSDKQKKLALFALQKYKTSTSNSNNRNWRFRLEIGRGSEHNASANYLDPAGNIGNQVTSEDIPNNFQLLYIEGHYSFKSLIYARLSEYRREYSNGDNLKKYDFLRRTAHIGIRSRYSGNLYVLATEYEAMYRGATTYLDTSAILLRSIVRPSEKTYLLTSLTLKKATSNDPAKYDYLQGDVKDIQTKYTYRHNNGLQIGLNYKLTIYNRNNIIIRDEFKGDSIESYSPTIQKLGLFSKISFSKNLWFQIERSRRTDKYPEEYRNYERKTCTPIPGPPGLPNDCSNVTRRETRNILQASLNWRMSKSITVKTIYQKLKHTAFEEKNSIDNEYIYIAWVFIY